MSDNSDVKSPVDDFLDEYQSDMKKLCLETRGIFKECYKYIGRDNYEDFFTKMEEKINALSTLSSIDRKINEVKEERGKCSRHYEQLAHEKDGSQREKFKDFEYKIQDIIGVAKQYASDSLRLARDRYEKIRHCHFGEEENRTKNALLFQENVLELIDWLFINELERIDLRDIEDGSQKRDGGYKVLDGFNTEERCGFPFKHLFVECKNYMKPNWRDLMQTFAYTLCCQESKIYAIPLSLLISRENPDAENTTWKLRRLIFGRRIEREERLILFMDVEDLGNMLEYKEKGGDPAGLLKDKVEEFSNWNIKQGAN